MDDCRDAGDPGKVANDGCVRIEGGTVGEVGDILNQRIFVRNGLPNCPCPECVLRENLGCERSDDTEVAAATLDGSEKV